MTKRHFRKNRGAVISSIGWVTIAACALAAIATGAIWSALT